MWLWLVEWSEPGSDTEVRRESWKVTGSWSAYLNHSWLMGHCVKRLPLHRTWAREVTTKHMSLATEQYFGCKWPQRCCLRCERMHGVFHGDFLSDADCEGHQIQFSTALMGSGLHWQLGGNTSRVPLCLSGRPHKMLAYITSGKSEWGNGCSTFHKRTG